LRGHIELTTVLIGFWIESMKSLVWEEMEIDLDLASQGGKLPHVRGQPGY
jgi:hypothetical protein